MDITPRAIASATALIHDAFLGSPQFLTDTIGERAGCPVLVKVETCNPIRSFKGRGCGVLLATTDPDREIVAASAGNLGQGLAYAARATGHRVTVVAAETASPLKVERMRGLGADVVLEGDDFDAAKEHARRRAAASRSWFVEDGEHPELAVGAGTIGRELDRWEGDLERIYVPVGNGALAIGVGTWWRHHRPDSEIVGVVAAGAPAMARSWHAGRAVSTRAADTIADGIAVRVPTPGAVTLLQDVLDRVVQVTDPQIHDAMRLCWQDLGLVLEPAGVVTIAAILDDTPAPDGTVAAILTGSNVSDELARSIVSP